MIKSGYNGRLRAVIFDWAGTTIDFGCFAPTGVFIEIFRQTGINITMEEARGPMGKHKRDHITEIARSKRVSEEWNQRYGSECTDDDIDEMYSKFIPLQLSVLEKYSALVPELPEAVKTIRSHGLKIGSTTGYNREMMDIVMKTAENQGFFVDSMVCGSDVPAGRPAPWMAFRNAENLGIYPMEAIVKIGDTVADIKEGNNAGMWSVGVIKSSNEMGLSLDEINQLSPGELEMRMLKVADTFLNAGADYVINTLAETGDLIEKINSQLQTGKRPGELTIK
jgi:phosphonoacetaldehyde hydrolase